MRRRVLLAAAAGPAVLTLLVNLSMLAASSVGAHPFWQTTDFNLAEASAQSDAGEVARLLEAGADPNAVHPMRAGSLDNEQVIYATPVEAARRVGRDEIVRLLVDAGAEDPESAPSGR